MFLTEISDLIVIDEIINEKKYTHFLTHCENRFFTETGFTSKIYTSKNIARILYRHKKIPITVFNILQSNHTHKIQLSNGQNISVTLFEGDQYTNNICFHFQNSKTTLFYCGHFRNIYGLFKNQLCFDICRAGIEYLYLDNTRANAEYLSSVNEIGIKLKQIMKSHPSYKIIISLPNYGYEDLLVNLLLRHQFKIFIGIHQKDILTHLKFDNFLVNTIREAQLIIRKDVVDMDCIKERYTKKHGITVRIVEYDKEILPQNFEHIGLFQIHYSPHMTHFELYALISYIQPKFLRDIYPEFNSIPKFLKEASLVLCSDKEQLTNNNETLSESTLTKTDVKTDTVDSSKRMNSGQLPQSQNDHILYTTKNPEGEMNLNNNDRTQNDTKIDLQKPKKKYNNPIDKELTKTCPKMLAKNIIQELFDEFVDVDNVGDFCIPNADNMHKNLKDIPIFNSDNSDLSKCLLEKSYYYEKGKQDHELSYHAIPEPILGTENTQQSNSPRIGSKRLITYDDKLHTPKEKHRKLLVNNGKEINPSYLADLNINHDMRQKFNTIKAPIPVIHSKNRQNRNQITTLIKARNNRNISGIPSRSKNFQKKNTVNSKVANKMPTMEEIKNKIGSTEYSNKFSTVDCSKQKPFRRNMSRQIEYIYSDE